MPRLKAIRLYYPFAGKSLATLHSLGQKCYESTFRCLISASQTVISELDQALWTRPKKAFLPHGVLGSSLDAEQPILLQVIESVWSPPEGVGHFDRQVVLIDAHCPLTFSQTPTCESLNLVVDPRHRAPLETIVSGLDTTGLLIEATRQSSTGWSEFTPVDDKPPAL